MNISRRSVLTNLIAAPAVISIDNLMPVRLWVPTIYGDAIHDDWEGVQAWRRGERVNILPSGFAPRRLSSPKRYFRPTGRKHGIIATEVCLLDDEGLTPSRYNMAPVFYSRENII